MFGKKESGLEGQRVVWVFFMSVFVVLALGVMSGTAAAQSAPDCSAVTYDGSGMSDDPYEVSNVDELQCIEEQGLNAHYVQTDDIDASVTEDWNDGDGFDPIGESPGFNEEDTEFNGTFDGNGHTITDLYIDRPDTARIGLFGLVESNATITNVGVENADFSGGNFAGGLVGENYGTVEESYATGDVTGDTNVGGLVGENYGSVEESHATADVSGDRFRVGGLVGENEGTVGDSYATGSVSGEDRVGGLVGDNDEDATVTESYATGDVSGDEPQVGGLVGTNSGGTVTESYATGDVSGGGNGVGGLLGSNGGIVENSYATGDASSDASEVGGLVGGNVGTVTESYATGDVTGDEDVGGLIGDLAPGGEVEDSYWDTETTGQDESDGGTGLTTSEMTGSAAPDNMGGFDFEEVWTTVTNPDDYPELREIDTPDDDDDDGVDESTGVSTAEDLQEMEEDLDGDYVLEDDIDGEDFDDDFEPIGDSDNPFNGTFDGNGNTISNLTNDDEDDPCPFEGEGGETTSATALSADSEEEEVRGVPVFCNLDGGASNVTIETEGGSFGLAGTIESDGEVSGVHVSGSAGRGAIAGVCRGAIVCSSSSATIVAEDGVAGGLVGVAEGGAEIHKTQVTGDVNVEGDSGFVGGLVGRLNDSEVHNSSARGEVIQGGEAAGGLIGSMQSGAEVSTSYAVGEPDGVNKQAGLVGNVFEEGSTPLLRDSYWDTETTGQQEAVPGVDVDGITVNNAEGLATQEMQGASAVDNMSGLDFEVVWREVTEPENDYPVLQCIEGDVEDEGLFTAPLIEAFDAPPQNTGELDDDLIEDLSGDGDGADVGQTVQVFGELIRGEDLGLTDEEAALLNWNDDSPSDEVTVADMVSLFGEQIRVP